MLAVLNLNLSLLIPTTALSHKLDQVGFCDLFKSINLWIGVLESDGIKTME